MVKIPEKGKKSSDKIKMKAIEMPKRYRTRFSIDRRLGPLTPFGFNDFITYADQLREIVNSRLPIEREQVYISYPGDERMPYEDFSEIDWYKAKDISLAIIEEGLDSSTIWFSHNKYWRDQGRLFFNGQSKDKETIENIEKTFKKSGLLHSIGDGWKRDPEIFRTNFVKSCPKELIGKFMK